MAERPAKNTLKNALVIVAVSLILVGCGTTRTERSGAMHPSMGTPSRVLPGQADDVTIYAVGLVGTPYRYGGNTPDTGFDCSGLIGHVYQTRAGLLLPRTVAKLQSWGQSVPSDEVRAGDLVTFAQGGTATHAGIYVGNGRFVHAPSSGGEVRLDSLASKYWASKNIAFRRP